MARVSQKFLLSAWDILKRDAMLFWWAVFVVDLLLLLKKLSGRP